jgi:hypothetical protein
LLAVQDDEIGGWYVFQGIYKGIVEGWIDVRERAPGLLTGEELGQSEGNIREGRIVGM